VPRSIGQSFCPKMGHYHQVLAYIGPPKKMEQIILYYTSLFSKLFTVHALLELLGPLSDPKSRAEPHLRRVLSAATRLEPPSGGTWRPVIWPEPFRSEPLFHFFIINIHRKLYFYIFLDSRYAIKVHQESGVYVHVKFASSLIQIDR
jgi:hypothetical protein